MQQNNNNNNNNNNNDNNKINKNKNEESDKKECLNNFNKWVSKHVYTRTLTTAHFTHIDNSNNTLANNTFF